MSPVRSARLAYIVGCLLAPASFGQTGFVNWETPHVSPIALTPSGNTLLAVNTADDRLEVFDVSGGGPVWTGSIAVGIDPVSVRCRSESEIWVVNHVSDSISLVDLPTRRVYRTLQTGDEPTDVVFAGTPQRAFVSVSQLNQIRVFDPANLGAAPTVIAVQGEDPRALTVSPDGTRVYAAIFESANPTTIVNQQSVSNVNGPYGGQNPPPNSGNAFSPPIAAGLPNPPPVAQIVRRNGAGQWRDDNNRDWSQFITWNLHDHDVAIIDTATLAVSYASGMLTNVMAIGVKPDGGVTIVGTEARNELRFEPNVNGIFIRCMMGTFAQATPGTTTTADLNPHLTYGSSNVPVATREQSIGDPRAIVWHPTSGRGYVTGMGSSNVIAIDASGARLARIDVGQGPTGIAMKADGSRLYVLNKFDGTVSMIDTTTDAEAARVPFFDPTPSAIKQGRPMLYDTHRTSGLGQAACASCHIDARTDALAWDLGNPAGSLKLVNQPCQQGPGNCRPWHPMKGPMVTQTLVNIVGTEPLHWRGDRENIAAFSPAFTDLQGTDQQPTSQEMQQLTDFIATIKFPPNPNRNIDATLPTALPSSAGGTGNASIGFNLFQTLPVLGGGPCTVCHTLPSGTSGRIDSPPGPAIPQSLKMAQLRNMHEKTGFSRASQQSNRGFGFNHHSDQDTLFNLLQVGFTFAPGAQGIQQRKDIEAFMLCFSTDTHAGVGQQVTFDGTNNTTPAPVARLTTFVNLANAAQVGLIAKGTQGGLARGWVYVGSNVMQSDRAASTTTVDALRLGAAAESEITFTLVPIGTQRRIGVDRDGDTYLDRDEMDVCSNPADATSTPAQSIPADLNCDTHVDEADLELFAACRSGPNVPRQTTVTCARADLDSDNDVDQGDFGLFQRCYSGSTATPPANCASP